MKITVGLPSRNRPAGLVSVLTALDALASGLHEITYAVIVDDDDSTTPRHLLPQNAHILSGPREKLVAARFNEAMEAFPADMYMQACDDSFPLAFKWDVLLHGARELPAFSWQECNDPANATYPVISERWRKAVGRFYPEYFPFWFADTWIAEVYNLAFAKPIGVVNQLQMGGKRGQTQSMRDLEFWFDFFAATRVERIAEAVAVAKAFGFSLNVEKDRQNELQRMKAGDTYQKGRIALYEGALGAGNEPLEVYINAKRKAEEWLKLQLQDTEVLSAAV